MRRIVYVSTINVFGNTRGRIVDESYRRDPADGFLSWYDETKFRAHEVAVARAAAGAPVVIVQPGGVYGPGDHSGVGDQLTLAHRGRLRYLAFADLGLNLVHVDDVAGGIVGAHDHGSVGEAYVLGAENVRVVRALEIAARLGGHRLPRLRLPAAVVRAASRLPSFIPRPATLPTDLREVVRAVDGVTYWASDAKARRELRYRPMDLETGLRRTFAAA